jgi:hypothetical protein
MLEGITSNQELLKRNRLRRIIRGLLSYAPLNGGWEEVKRFDGWFNP